MKRGICILVVFSIFSQANYAQFLQSFAISSSFQLASDEKEEKNTSQTPSLDLFLFADEKTSTTDSRASFISFVDKMKSKNDRIEDERYLLKNLFYKVHNKYLKNYSNFVSFTDIFDTGEYDCVTGTALYAIILDELGYSYEIHEFDFHVLLIVELPEGNIMFESTDFSNGFVENEEEIESRLAYYRESRNDEKSEHYIYKTNNNRKIELKELAGLLYFNLAVKQYNMQNFEFALQYLEKAESLYHSERMQELRHIILDILEKDGYMSLNK